MKKKNPKPKLIPTSFCLQVFDSNKLNQINASKRELKDKQLSFCPISPPTHQVYLINGNREYIEYLFQKVFCQLYIFPIPTLPISPQIFKSLECITN